MGVSTFITIIKTAGLFGAVIETAGRFSAQAGIADLPAVSVRFKAI